MLMKFLTQAERKETGGTCFIELQMCLLPEKTSLKKILTKHDYWRDDSVYVHADQPFYSVYKDVFGEGIHPNLETGSLDDCGVTYYRADQIDEIIRRADEAKPEGYSVLVDWLKEAKKHNGFYILGV